MKDGETGEPLLAQFWDAEGAHIDFTSEAGVAWWQAGLERAVLTPGIDVAWNDNNEYELWDEDAVCDGFGHPVPLALVRPVQPLLMDAGDLGGAAAAHAGSAQLHHHPRRLPRHPALRADLERRQHDELGDPCAGICAPACRCLCPECTTLGMTSAVSAAPYRIRRC